MNEFLCASARDRFHSDPEKEVSGFALRYTRGSYSLYRPYPSTRS